MRQINVKKIKLYGFHVAECINYDFVKAVTLEITKLKAEYKNKCYFYALK